MNTVSEIVTHDNVVDDPSNTDKSQQIKDAFDKQFPARAAKDPIIAQEYLQDTALIQDMFEKEKTEVMAGVGLSLQSLQAYIYSENEFREETANVIQDSTKLLS